MDIKTLIKICQSLELGCNTITEEGNYLKIVTSDFNDDIEVSKVTTTAEVREFILSYKLNKLTELLKSKNSTIKQLTERLGYYKSQYRPEDYETPYRHP